MTGVSLGVSSRVGNGLGAKALRGREPGWAVPLVPIQLTAIVTDETPASTETPSKSNLVIMNPNTWEALAPL